ncbi:trihelix transcription factor ASR3-like [Phragmites australis]|uniref:trihelix transcription factor ASR3-like n=1 Tax=Phragmites australis TaxID=29695 RepID=UPI002D76B72C|nr:trihelix transcription factor ASR3-like [Phragmites australis]
MSANENSPRVEAAAASTPRSRLPRWTRHETLVLIQARRAMERRGLQLPVRPRPKWAAVSAYCGRHGVERGPMQCRKRWGNLSWDLKKIVAWEGKAAAAAPQHESFWDMRGEQRRARQLPSSFDREVYNALVCGTAAGEDAAVLPDFGEELDGVYEQPPIMVMPISARKYEPPPASSEHECSDPVTESEKKAGAASDKNSTSQQNGGGGGGGFKDSDATFVAGAEGTTAAATPAETVSIGKQVVEALERGNRALAQQLEAQKINWDADREQRTALLATMDKLTDAVARIADKL